MMSDGSLWYLVIAILFGVLGTMAMKLSHGFHRLKPLLFLIIFYSISFIALTLAMQSLDVSVVYAVWSGVGTVLVAVIGMVVFHESFSLLKIFSILFIVAGVEVSILSTSSLKFKPPLIAHRGASSLAPENTLAAFGKAYELGAKWIEFDVMLSADGEVVVIHDDTLDRTTTGHGKVSDFTYAEIAKLDAGSWFGQAFVNERVPTFKEVIAFLHAHKMAANVEIKAVPGQEHEVVKKVLAEIKQYWGKDLPPPLISSFSMPILRLVRQEAPHVMIGVLIHDWFDGWQNVCEELHCSSVNLSAAIVTPQALHMIKSGKKRVLVYTVDDPLVASRLFHEGVDAVFTNNFAGMDAALKS
jgi:glycerophosphoryl diester phosphodiesterase